MLAYHMGWEGQEAVPIASGKRIRPLIVLLVNQAAGGVWQNALPSAAAVELLHNFSLIHDDIEDDSPLRRGRETVWKLWGIPQAINAGDAMFALSHIALTDLAESVSPEIALQSANIFQTTCLELTIGQHMDLAYEARGDLTLDAYWPMVGGKTAALLSCCTELGALAAGANPSTCAAYHNFGRDLGLAFQALDDLLGIWGDAALMGKSAASDLLSGKKSLPVLFGLGRDGRFKQRWEQGPINPEEVSELAAQLEEDGARAYVQERAQQLTTQALEALNEAGPQGDAGQALLELANNLLQRKA
jgi:geranylgeranyl diphosphate synthase type I